MKLQSLQSSFSAFFRQQLPAASLKHRLFKGWQVLDQGPLVLSHIF